MQLNQKLKINILILYIVAFNSYYSQESKNQIFNIDWEDDFTYTDNKGWVIEQDHTGYYYYTFTSGYDTGDPVVQCSFGSQFGIFGSKVSKVYSSLPKHYQVNVSMGITYMFSWDNEQLQVKLDSNLVYDETPINFYNFITIGYWNNSNRPCSIDSTQSPHYWSDIQPNYFSFTIDHTSPTLNVEVIPYLDEAMDNEGIGLQNVIVSVKTCYFTCQECDGPLQTNCTACPANSTQNGTECQCNVGYVAYQNDCIASCPSGYTANTDRICIDDCPVDNCQTCVDKICTACETSYKLLNGKCYDRCPWFTTDGGSSCSDSTYDSISTNKFYALIDLINTEFEPLDLLDNYSFTQQKQYNGNSVQAFTSNGSDCFGDKRQFLIGFGVYNGSIDCKSLDCKVKRSIQISEIHYKVLIRLQVVYGDFNDQDDYIKIYIDGNEISSTKPSNVFTNDCGVAFSEAYEEITVEVNHTQSTLEIALEPYLDLFGKDEWVGFRELSIVVYQCFSDKCASCNNDTDCLTCFGDQRSGNQCDCPSELYWDNYPSQMDCQQCVNNRCLTCSNGTDCATCKFNTLNNRIPSSLCSCPDEYFDDPSETDCQSCTSNCFTCVTTSSNCIIYCDHKCTSCSGSQSTCDSCRGDRILSDNCQCDYHKYDDNSSELCQECHDQCEECLVTGCQICRGNRETNNASDMQCVCPSGGIDHQPDTYYCTTCQVAVIQKLQLSDDYLQIYIQFFVDIEIFNFLNNESIWSNELCVHLFQDQTLNKLGGNVQCIIDSTDGIQIKFQDTPSINVGDQILFNQDSIKQVGCQENFNTFIFTELQLHNIPLPPSVLIQGPTSEISLCEEQQLLIVDITNDGYRGLKDISWSLKSSNDQQTQDFEDLLLKQTNQFFVDIPSLLLNEFKEYVVQVQYSNKFDIIGISTIQITSGSYKGVYANLKKTEPFIFKNFKQITFEGTIKYLDCLSGQIEEKNQVLNVKWVQKDDQNNEIVLSEYQSSDKDRTTQIAIEPYQHIAGNTYQISLTASLPDNTFVGQNNSDYKVELVPLLVYIQGGNRMNAYASPLNIECVGKDPNLQKEIQSEGITYNWECINMNNNNPCEQIDGTLITFENGTQQTFNKKIFEPYNALLFNVEGTKNSESQIGQAVIIIVETNIPLLLVNVPESFLTEKLNKNDDLQIDILNESENNEDLFFSLIFIYDFEVVATKSFEYKSFSFRIWDLFDNFIPSVSELLVRVSMYNPKYFMPSQTSYNIQVNQPPQQGSISISPLIGNALETPFLIELNGYIDNDSPLSYKYQFYTSQDKYLVERQQGQNPTSSQKNILTDFRSQNSLTTILPQGDYNELNDQYEILIMVTVSDSLGGITNVTQTIQCEPNQQNSETQNIQNLQNIFDISETKNTEDQVKDLNLLAIQLQQLENIDNQITQNVDYGNLKANIYERLNQYVNLIPTKVLQDQAIKSINQLIKDPNLVANQSQQNIENSIQEMETILQNKQTELDQIKDTGLINTGDNKISRRNQEATLLLGNQIKFMDQMTNSFTFAKQRRRRYLTDENIINNQDKVFDLTKKINKALQTNSLPNEDAVNFEGDSFKQTVQKNNSKKIKERLFQDTSALNGYDQSDIINNFDSNDDGETEVIYETSTQIFKDNILKDKPGFPYPDQNEQMYDIDISDNKNPDKQIEINENITTSFGKVGSKKNQVCLSQKKDSTDWDNSACKNVEKENQYGKLEIQCQCKALTPTTVIQDLDNVFSDSTISQAFGDEGIQALANFKFWKSLIFYIFIIKTSLLVFLIYKGHKKDKIDLKHIEEQKEIVIQKKKQEEEQKMDVKGAKMNKLDLDLISELSSNNKRKRNKKFKNQVYPTQDNQNGVLSKNSQQDFNKLDIKEKGIDNDDDLDIDLIDTSPFRSSIRKKNTRRRLKKKSNKIQVLGLEDQNQSQQNSDVNQNQNQQENQNNNNDQNSNETQQNNNENQNQDVKNNDIQENQQQMENNDIQSQREFNTQNSLKQLNQQTYKQDDITENQNHQENKQQSLTQFQISDQELSKNEMEKNQQKKDNQKQQQENTDEIQENSKGEKQKKETVYIQQKEVINFVLRIHELLGIHYLYDPKLSRPVRYLCFYLKICIVLGFTSSVIDKNSTQYESILISSVTSIISSIPIAILKSLLSKKNIVKCIGFVLYLGVSGASIFLMITNAALMGVETSNNWTMAYFSSFLIDVFFYQVLAGFGKLAVFNWSIGKQGCPLIIRKILALDKGMSKYFTRDNIIDDLDISV